MPNKNKENSIPIEARELRALNQPVLDEKAGDLSGSDFWQYTSINSINYILDGDCFWVNNIAAMNDLREIEFHRDEKEDVFVQCFCNSNKEKIPMWYLYGGIVGKGASIGLTPGMMQDYINSIKYVTELIADPRSSIKKYVPGEKLKIGDDFELQSGWVFYVEHNGDYPDRLETSSNIEVKYRNKRYKVDKPEEFYKQNYFIKDYPWEYEREFRIVFINKTGRYIEKIKIDIPERFRKAKNKKLKVRLGPEISSIKPDLSGESEFDRCKQAVLENAEKNDKIDESYDVIVDKSKLKISMDLMKKNMNDIINYISEHPDYLSKNM